MSTAECLVAPSLEGDTCLRFGSNLDNPETEQCLSRVQRSKTKACKCRQAACRRRTCSDAMGVSAT